MIEDWTINCGYFEWPACYAYFDIATPEEDWRTELHVEFDVIDYGKGNPLADNPNDYYGGYDYEWHILKLKSTQ